MRIDLVGDAMREKVNPLSEPFELALRSKCCSVAQLSVGRMMWLIFPTELSGVELVAVIRRGRSRYRAIALTAERHASRFNPEERWLIAPGSQWVGNFPFFGWCRILEVPSHARENAAVQSGARWCPARAIAGEILGQSRSKPSLAV